MSENDISDNDQSTLALPSVPPVPPAPAQVSVRSLVAAIVVMALVIAFGAGLVWSKRDKNDTKVVVGSNGQLGSSTKPGATAAIVNGTKISAQDLDRAVAPWIANKDFVASMQQGNSPIVDAKGEPLLAYRAQRLDALIQQTIFDREFEKSGLKVSKSYVADLRTQVAADPSAKGFSAAFLDEFVEARGRFEALRVARSKPIGDEQVKTAYDQQYACESGKGVAHLLVKTEAEADAALQRIQKGETFAAVAQAVSTDTGSKEQGGELGCLKVGAFVPEFEKAATSAVVGMPTAPVKSQFGFHVIKTSAFVAPALAEVRAEIVAALQAQDTSGNEALRKFLDSAKVQVDAFIGSWGPNQQGVPGVIPKGAVAAPGAPGQPPATPTTVATSGPSVPGVQEERPPKKSK